MKLFTVALITIALLASVVSAPAQQPRDRFGDVTVCSLCHRAIPLPGGSTVPPPGEAPESGVANIAPFVFWPASMMAHSSRDPYWEAKVNFEGARLPAMKEIIEDTCLRCHAPMQQYPLRASKQKMALSSLNAIGKQGVACTVCHQITPEGFGEKRSFEAGFVINGEFSLYGPHDNPYTMPMLAHSGYTAAKGSHITDSAMCGTCHTVITPSVDATGKIVGEFVEQAPYLEWLVSDLPDLGASCQSCHMPTIKDSRGGNASQYIAHRPPGGPFPPTRPRQPFGMHYLVGGNLPGLNMLRDVFPNEKPMLDHNAARTKRFLEDALSLSLTGERNAGQLSLSVKVTNNTGHKLPTAFPSRRVWLHATITAANGKTVFESGAWDEKTGEITGVAGLEPHYSRIASPDQVIIYEAEMANTDGEPTVSLLRGHSYAKDNRLLPSGFDLTRKLPQGIESASIAPVGTSADKGFTDGQHEIVYEVSLASAPAGPYRATVEAFYQSIKPSHAAAMRNGKSRAEQAFKKLFENHNSPAPMTSRELVID